MPAPIRVAVTGMGRQDVSEALNSHDGIEPVPMSDLEAAAALQQGSVSYVVGVCESGGGAALAMAIAVVGPAACTNLSSMGRPPDPQSLPAHLDAGVRVFGIARDHAARVASELGRALLDRPAPAAAPGQ